MRLVDESLPITKKEPVYMTTAPLIEEFLAGGKESQRIELEDGDPSMNTASQRVKLCIDRLYSGRATVAVRKGKLYIVRKES